MSPLFFTILKQVADCESYLRMTFVCLICLVSHFTSYLFLSLFNAAGDYFEKPGIITGSPSSKYEHRYCCITFELTRFVGGEKPIVSVTYQYERISTEKKTKKRKEKKKRLALLKMCVRWSLIQQI